ncbi:MAG: class I SAM-dependent DNA methyltransferase [Chloroflexi bacterium]|nr:class I SAM-dependent DNA methyltransferase [Chloroflexota bacterium]
MINEHLAHRLNLTKVARLSENIGISFQGDTKVGPFEIDAATAQKMLSSPNPDGRLNSDVGRPWVNGLDITRRRRNMWIADFPPGTTEDQASLYEAPFRYVVLRVKPERATLKSGDATGVPWWIHQRPRPAMREALAQCARYLVTTSVAKHRLFCWLEREVVADHKLFVFAREDDYFFGVLQSRVHEFWALAKSSRHGVGNDPVYNNTTRFETFPLPWPPGAEPWGDTRVLGISLAARELNDLREGWLKPGLVGGLALPDVELKKRTLTNLYNERPAWLVSAHRKLDEAAFAAYGWPENPGALSKDEILGRLLQLNAQRAGRTAEPA